ncbi:hypothetical protein ABZ759_00305 [Streptomyces sp. NPDC047860]|uniref:hypothetical protein n=1 Tax=Streptomyces sp. NPDC047860 TaxID=3155743 RepID=UPI00340C3E17
MSWSPAVSDAALRAMRVTAGRRLVQLALLVGAVFVLGVLCGERAQAADGAPQRENSPVAATVLADPRTPDSNAVRSLVDTLTVPRPEAADPIRPLTETVVRSVGERVVRPAGELVGTVTEGLGQVPGALPGLPLLPGPEQSAPLPELPALPGAPADTLPEPTTPGRPSSPSAEAPEAPEASEAPQAPDAADAPTPDAPDAPDRPARTAAPAHHGPALTGVDGVTHAGHGERGGHGRGAPDGEGMMAGQVLAPHAPVGGGSDGAVGSRSAADHGTQRHGDACAVPAFRRPAPGLVPGLAERAEASGTRDQCRDVPVSPA